MESSFGIFCIIAISKCNSLRFKEKNTCSPHLGIMSCHILLMVHAISSYKIFGGCSIWLWFKFHLVFVGWVGCGVFQKGPPVIPESTNWPIREYLVHASILFTLQLIACPHLLLWATSERFLTSVVTSSGHR